MKNSALYHLDLFIDDDGLLHVGGRLRRSHLVYEEKHPMLISKGHHLAKFIIKGGRSHTVPSAKLDTGWLTELTQSQQS